MDNQKDEVVEDFLEVDQKIPGQNFVCLSVVNPEKVLKRKEEFLFYHYHKLKMEEHIQRLESNIKSLLEKRNEETNAIEIKDVLHLKKNMSNGFNIDLIDFSEFKEKYEDFMFTKSIEIGKEFDKNNNFQTSIRGVKVRGVYDTYNEAESRAKKLQKMDNTFDVFVGQVGYWLPLITDTNHIENNEYANEELNTLVKSYQENQTQKDLFYQERTREMKEDAATKLKEHKKKQEKEKKMIKIEEVEEDGDVKEDKEMGNVEEDKELNNTVKTMTEEDPWLSRQTSLN
jgi:hypothetical protein